MLCVLEYSHLQLFHESRVTMFLQISKRITSGEYKEFTLLLSVMSIFQQKFSSESLVDLPSFLHDIPPPKKVSNNDHIPVMKLNRELYDS